MKKILEISNFSLLFESERGHVQAVNDLSLSLHKGETLGLVGESGSGKSVTALSIMGLLAAARAKVTNGQIRLFKDEDLVGLDLLGLGAQGRSKVRGSDIAMIFQEPMTSLNPVFTCGWQVTESIQQHQQVSYALAKQQALAFFEKVKLPDPQRIFDAYPHQLSGGQKQRVMIAMALCCRPAILIADEPTTALDVTVQKAILDLLLELKRDTNLSILFISHDLGVVSEICDRVAVMHQGQIVETGTPEQIFRHAQHPYTKGLAACRPSIQQKRQRLSTIQDFYTPGFVEARVVSSEETNERRAQLYQRPPLLSVQNLTVRYPKRTHIFGQTKEWLYALKDVSFDVFPGESFGLAGESGCGKSTLGRSIARLTPAHSGKAYYNGTDLFALTEDAFLPFRREIQLVFQDPYGSLNPRMTAGEAILEPMKVHGLYEKEQTCREKTVELLEMVGLTAEHGRNYPDQFSGGQRQRVCIARALALQPKILICDEIVSALDVSVQATVLNLLADLQVQLGLTYLFISHDLSVLHQMCDRLMVMKDGRTEMLGFPEDMLRQTESSYTHQLMAAIPGKTLMDGESNR